MRNSNESINVVDIDFETNLINNIPIDYVRSLSISSDEIFDNNNELHFDKDKNNDDTNNDNDHNLLTNDNDAIRQPTGNVASENNEVDDIQVLRVTYIIRRF